MSSNVLGTQLSILDLTKTNLEVKAGEFVAIVGRSGCGKSSLLRLMSGLDKATTGGILLHRELLCKFSRSVDKCHSC
ncbi:ATP-binding cassette domain-containing protein [Nostoc sp. WHI]|uniref:ATP-binding cassette domain-containing protein n=1 Tax=Nostoc sp. WHI TaxID=2650611 RepID=UPI003FA5BC40